LGGGGGKKQGHVVFESDKDDEKRGNVRKKGQRGARGGFRFKTRSCERETNIRGENKVVHFRPEKDMCRRATICRGRVLTVDLGG